MDYRVVITFFRHGITVANKQKRYLGWSDEPIMEEAKMNLLQLQKEFFDYDYCVTSDLLRCRQTAEILCPERLHHESDLFREMNFGAWELKTFEELASNERFVNWLNHPFSFYGPPYGECFQEMKERINHGWTLLQHHITEKNIQKTMLITHGGVIRYLLTKLTKVRKNFWGWDIPHGTGITLYWNLADWEEKKPCTSLQVVPIMEKENG